MPTSKLLPGHSPTERLHLQAPVFKGLLLTVETEPNFPRGKKKAGHTQSSHPS